jgi:hypothetical protein
MLKPLLAALLLSAQAPGAPGPVRCLTRAEVGDLTLVGASVAVEVVRNACRAYLPATAFLETPAGAAFSARLRVEGQHRLDSAIDGVARLSGSGSSMPRAGVRAMVGGLMNEGAGADFARQADASMCRDANELMEIASTLSPDQMARFVGALASLADHVARMQAAHHLATPPSGATPSPHPAALDMAPTAAPPRVIVPTAPPPVVITPVRPGPPAPPGSHHPTMTPFLCQQPE